MFCLLLTTTPSAHATTVTVNSIAALQTAINTAAAGDSVLLANGTYLNTVLTIATADITVRAVTNGGVFLNGNNSITITGNNVTFGGFQFTSGSIPGIIITVEGNHVVLTQLNFNGYSAQKYVNFKGQFDELCYSNIENKPTSAPIGNLIHISTRTDNTPTYTRIHHNSFKNMPGAGGDNGNECIRITNANPATYTAGCIIEYNYFNNTGYGDSEVISVKSEGNVIRYNTMENNNKGNFCFRIGNNNVAYGNFFRNSGGIRIKQSNNIHCYNNYFENCGDGSITAPFKFVYVTGGNMNCILVHNTVVGGSPVEIDAGGSANTMANNIFKNTTGSIFSGTMSGISFAGNIYQGTLGVSISSGMTNTDPKLSINTDGYYGLSSTSPAIDASSTNYPSLLDVANIDDDPNLLLDISKQPRPSTPGLKDVGCDEFSTAGTVSRPLTLQDVGPYYLGGPISGTKQNQTITFPTLPVKVTGDADFNPGATASSGLAVTYTSSNTAVATIVNGMIHIVSAGSTIITASQAGNSSYNPAPDVSQPLTVNAPVIYNYSPSSAAIVFGSVKSGNYSNLSSNNGSYYVVNSTTSGTRKIDWYCSTMIGQPNTTVTKLTVRYDGKYSQVTTQVLYLFDWTTLSWIQIDSRSFGTSDVTVTTIPASPARFVSSTGEVRVRVYSSGGTKNYTCSGDWVQVSVETSALRLSAPTNSVLPATNVGIKENQTRTEDVFIYPNPSGEFVRLDYVAEGQEHVVVTVYDSNGSVVKMVGFENRIEGSYSMNVDLHELKAGTYSLRIVLGDRLETTKVVVRK